MKAALLPMLAAVLVPALVGQTPRSTTAAAPQPSGTGVITGAVVSTESDAKPVRLAYVVIIGAATGVLRVTSTDQAGRFSFANLPADRYVVGASKAPYLGAVAGARRPARPGTPIALADGEQNAGVVIRLPPGAAISGVIVDERGEPAAGAVIGLMQRRLQGGERPWTPVGGNTTTTDERGRYRVYGLTPGEYLVVATHLGGRPIRPLPDAEVDAVLRGGRATATPAVDPATTYAPVYFPGTSRADDAVPILVTVGEDRQQVDFRIEPVRTSRLDVAVVAADGRPPTEVSVRISGSISNALQTQSVMRLAGGVPGGVSGLAPGTYRIVASEAGPQGRFASATVDLAGIDQSVQLVLAPPLTLAARIAFEGAAPPPALAGRRVPLRSLMPGGDGIAGPQVSATNAEGAFNVTGLIPGAYVLGGPLYFGATSDSVTWALESVVADGTDVTDLPLAVGTDMVPKDIVVTFGDRWQELTGRLRHESGAPATDYTVIVFPADKRYWLPGSRRILITRPGTDGGFRLGGPGPTTLPPGSYLLGVVTDLERDEQFDPALLASLVASAAPVTLQPGERRVQDVSIK